MALLNKMTKEQLVKIANERPQGSSNSQGIIFESGVYPIKIKFVEIAKARNSDAKSFAIRYERNGSEGTLFGPYIYNKDGQQNKIGFEKLIELQAILGVNEMNTETKEVTTKETYKAEVIKEFAGKEVIVQTMLEYGKFNGDVRRSIRIVGFFRKSDLASFSELVGNSEVGSRYTFVTSGDKPRCKEVRYLDGVTPDEANAFEEKRVKERANNTQSTTTTSSNEISFDEDDNNELPF